MLDKGKIKKFAISARKTLISEITIRLRQIGIDENGIAGRLPESTREIEYYSKTLGTQLTGSKISWRRNLVNILNQRKKKTDWKTALQDIVEEVAYTWFNRIIAIRFMEVNDYLPSRTRILSSEEGRNQPDVMFHALELEDDLGVYTAEERNLIKRAQETKKTADMDSMYSMLFIKQADALRQNLPYLFEKTSDYMKLLFTPRYSTGVIKDLITQIPESYFDVDQEGQVEIIGWLYQYYNTELKDQAFKKKNYTTTDIPAVTQLFTPDWIVKYLVQNSFGRYWINVLQAKGDTRSPKKIAQDFSWEYFIPAARQENDPSNFFNNLREIEIEQITFIDPAMGSGHILVYAFDVFMQIYVSLGYSQKESADKIIKNNLYGLDIDTRAFQLSYFALMMKIRQYDRRGLDKPVELHIADVSESGLDEKQLSKLTQNRSEDFKSSLQTLLNEFNDGNDLGSIIKIDSQIDLNEIQKLTKDNNQIGQISFADLKLNSLKNKLKNIVKVASLLSRKYTISVTNPPYMGSGKMNSTLKKYVQKNYPNSKADLFSVFMEKVSDLTINDGYFAMITQHSWMFLSSFETLRKKLQTKTIVNMAHLGPRAFEEIGGEVVQSTAFVMFNQSIGNYIGTYERLIGYNSQKAKEMAYLSAINDNKNKILFCSKQANFSKIPGSPIAYWASENLIHDFEIGTSMDMVAEPKHGLTTGNNKLFLRRWFEVDLNRILFKANNSESVVNKHKKWVPYNKGGAYRKWYGNYDYVINWENNGLEIKNFKWPNGKKRSIIENENYYFREAITWSALSSGSISFRFTSAGFLFDTKGPELFSKISDIPNCFIVSFLNSKVVNLFLEILAPTLDFNPGSISRLSFIKKISVNIINNCKKIANLNIDNSKKDWDSFETSWDFKHHPLLNHIAEHKQNWSLEAAYDQWEKEALDRFNQLKANEEELNRIFINLYGLQDELTPEEDDKDVTVRKADKTRDIKSFLSFFIGCVLGRYSLDIDGLAYAGEQWNDDNYHSFKPNKENIIVLTGRDYFGDQRDVINRLQQFLIAIFGKNSLQANLNFIAEALNSDKFEKGYDAKSIVREYFLKDFYKDHCKTYQKRPIYWEINSGRRNGFKALFYLHRYDQNTMSVARENMHELQKYYETSRRAAKQQLLTEIDKKVIKQLRKEVKQLDDKLDEIIKFDSSVQHIANKKITIDLDDGVLVNHQKVQESEKLLSKI